MAVSSVLMVLLMLGMMVFLANHPVSLGGSTLLVKMLVFVVVGGLYSPILPAGLLLVFVGGLLVALGYVVALVSDPMFSGSAGESGVKLVLSSFFIMFAFTMFLLEGRVLSGSMGWLFPGFLDYNLSLMVASCIVVGVFLGGYGRPYHNSDLLISFLWGMVIVSKWGFYLF